METADGVTERRTDRPRWDARDLAAALADELSRSEGRPWRVVTRNIPERHYAMLAGPGDRESVHVELDTDGGRAVLSGAYPRIDARGRLFDARTETVRIGVSAARGTAAVAKEAARRLLPEYRRLLSGHMVALAAHDAKTEARSALARRLGALVGEAPRGEDDTLSLYGRRLGEGAFGTIKCSPDGTVALDLHGLTAAQAEAALLAILEIAGARP